MLKTIRKFEVPIATQEKMIKKRALLKNMIRPATILFMFVIVSTMTITNTSRPVFAQNPIAVIAVDPILIDTRNLKQVGDTFSVNVTIANVEKMWGYEFVLRYNASVINATNYVTLDSRFQIPLPSEIGSNYTTVSQGTYNGDPTGITTTAPLPVVKIDFVVTGTGTSNMTFEPVLTDVANIYGNIVPSEIVDGRFSNTELLALHDVGVGQATLSTDSAFVGDQITITLTVTNFGDVPEDVTVIAKYNASLSTEAQIGTSQSITGLAADTTSSPLTFTWNTAGLIEAVYQIKVEASIPVDNKISDNIRTVGFVTLRIRNGIHDVGIAQATLSTTSGIPGVVVAINVTVANLGNYTEGVTVTAKYNKTGTSLAQIGSSQTISKLAPHTISDPIIFNWDTGSVAAKIYEVTIVAAVQRDDKISDNTLVAGIVKLTLLDDLLKRYDALNSTYNQLLSQNAEELNFLRNLVYIQTITTIALVAVAVYLAVRKPRIRQSKLS